MKSIVIIPSRYSSTRLPGKPLILINGKPIIQHTIEKVMLSRNIDSIAVVTDDQRIYATVKKLNIDVFMSPKTCKNGTDRIAFAALEFLEDYDIFINVQCDEPLIDYKLIDKLLFLLKNNKDIEYATAICRIINEKDLYNKNVVKVVINKKKYAMYFSRSAIPYGKKFSNFIFYKHIGVYAYKREFLINFSKMETSYLEKVEDLEQLRALENCKKIKTIIFDHDFISVNTIDDILEVKKYL
jgi:3-deoxy-manno-octulosonate cytidylyltransferase (CMP-KDO synthetase)